jgi:hypothetical protein
MTTTIHPFIQVCCDGLPLGEALVGALHRIVNNCYNETITDGSAVTAITQTAGVYQDHISATQMRYIREYARLAEFPPEMRPIDYKCVRELEQMMIREIPGILDRDENRWIHCSIGSFDNTVAPLGHQYYSFKFVL